MNETDVNRASDRGENALKLRDLVYRETGMYFPDEKSYYFESRFARRMEVLGLSSFGHYYQYLTNPFKSEVEFNHLVSELTINETSFFRNEPQFNAIRDRMIPWIIQLKKHRPFRRMKIWSAGCSSGEEVYSVAMILDEMKETHLRGWTLEVVGTDINQRVLDLADKGFYKTYPVLKLPEHYKERYLKQIDGGYVVHDCLRQYVHFRNLNLNDDMAMLFMKECDIILCKNVLIYFDESSKQRVIQHFLNNLIFGGYLFIGFSESLYGIRNRFRMIRYPGGVAYQKLPHI